jgi:hypothetical protein
MSKKTSVLQPRASKYYQGKTLPLIVSIDAHIAIVTANPKAAIPLEGLTAEQKKRITEIRDRAQRKMYSPSPPSCSRADEIPTDDQLIERLRAEDRNEIDHLKQRFGWIPRFYRCYAIAFGVEIDEVRSDLVNFNDVNF